MKVFLLILSFVFTTLQGSTQNGGGVNALPAGKYETIVKPNGGKWNKGDIILLPGNRYKITTSQDEGEYKFSEMAQRIFFVSGPLKTVFAKTALSGNKPVIIIPAAENEQQGLKLAAADVWGYHKN
jgi:hypothetical protein